MFFIIVHSNYVEVFQEAWNQVEVRLYAGFIDLEGKLLTYICYGSFLNLFKTFQYPLNIFD